MKIRIFFVMALTVGVTVHVNFLFAKVPIKFGKVSKAELEMKEYAPDPTAPAVVLCSYGYYDSQTFNFYITMRVKIFKKEGYDLASRKFRVGNKAAVRGKTFNLLDGKVVVDKLNQKNVYREKIYDDYYLLNIAMPNVKEGSVLDIEITYKGFPSVWYFQEDIPVKWSELFLDPNDFINYSKNYFGYVPLKVNERDHWVAENVPAFKTEPYMDSRENYIAKFEFEITEINIPGYYYESIATDWNSLSKSLIEYKHFGKPLLSGGFLKKTAKEIKGKYNNDQDMLRAAVNFVKTVDFNGQDRAFTSDISLKAIYDKKIGNSADINLMLVKLLKYMGYNVLPVVLSTKDNGKLSMFHPSFNRLNYVLAMVQMDSVRIFLDGTDKRLPYNMIPEKCLNGKGRTINKVNSLWVDIITDKIKKELVYYDLKMDDDLLLSGKLSFKRSQYAAYDFRKKMDKYTDTDEYLAALMEMYPGLEVNDFKIKNLDDTELPVQDLYDVTISDKVYQMDSLLYLNIALFEKVEENPFKAEKRIYPVDFGVPINKSGIVKITFPEGYSIVEVPKSSKFALPDKAAYFTYKVVKMNNAVLLQYKLVINKPLFVQNEYPDLKAFYNEIIKKEAEPIVIKTL